MHPVGPGLRDRPVVNLSRDASGLFCIHRLASLGARAVTIATPGAAPVTAAFGRGADSFGLTDPRLADAVAKAAVVVDDDAEDICHLLSLLPSTAVRVVITPFGRTGQYAGFTATDLTTEAFGGALSSSGQRDRAPVGLGGRLVATYVGGVAAAAAMAEARLAATSGVGAVVDVSAVEALAASMDRRAVLLLTRSYTGWDAERGDIAESPLVTGIFDCADGSVYVSTYGWHIRAVCRLIGDPVLDTFLPKPALALTEPGSSVFRSAVRDWLASRPRDEAVKTAQDIGWPVVPANSLTGALADPCLAESGLVEQVDLADPGQPVRLPTSGISFRPPNETR